MLCGFDKNQEFFIVIRGTASLSDVLADLNVEKYFDKEINVKIHQGVRIKATFIIDDW